MEERLQKLLAAAGVASRRAAEQLILAGRVTVNGSVARELGTRADAEQDDIRLDGRSIQRPAAHNYLMMHKPPGYTSTATDPHATRTVMELLPRGTPRVYPVGRLDRESEGLLVFTDDGALAQRLTHPRYHLAREYAVLVRGTVDDDRLRLLRAGTVVEGRHAAPAEVEPVEPPGLGAPQVEEGSRGPRRRRRDAEETPELWLRFVLHEGRKRQIRLTCERAGLEVLRLVRLSIGPLTLGSLPAGKTRPLRKTELTALRRATGLPEPPVPAAPPAVSAEPATRAARPPKRNARPAPPAGVGSSGARPRPSAAAGPKAGARRSRSGPGNAPAAAPRRPSRSPAGQPAAASSRRPAGSAGIGSRRGGPNAPRAAARAGVRPSTAGPKRTARRP